MRYVVLFILGLQLAACGSSFSDSKDSGSVIQIDNTLGTIHGNPIVFTTSLLLDGEEPEADDLGFFFTTTSHDQRFQCVYEIEGMNLDRIVSTKARVEFRSLRNNEILSVVEASEFEAGLVWPFLPAEATCIVEVELQSGEKELGESHAVQVYAEVSSPAEETGQNFENKGQTGGFK